MSLKEYILYLEIANLLELVKPDQKTLVEIFQQPQVDSKNSDSQVQNIQNWWNSQTDPRNRIEAAKRQVQTVLNIIGRDGIRGLNNEDLVPLLADIRSRLIRLYHKFPDPSQRAKYSNPQLNYATDTSKVSKL